MDPEHLAAAISRQVRLTRARRVLSQRELALEAGVSKSLVARIEAAELPVAVHRWLAALPELGVTLVVGAGPDGGESAEPLGAAVTELDAYRDLAGRRFPAHRRVEPFRLTTYWWSRHADQPLSAPNPPARLGWAPGRTRPGDLRGA